MSMPLGPVANASGTGHALESSRQKLGQFLARKSGGVVGEKSALTCTTASIS